MKLRHWPSLKPGRGGVLLYGTKCVHTVQTRAGLRGLMRLRPPGQCVAVMGQASAVSKHSGHSLRASSTCRPSWLAT